MPYIKQKDRAAYESTIKQLANLITEQTKDERSKAGHLNYIISRLLLETYSASKNFNSYSTQNEIVGLLECCKQEFYRRATAPYEDTKIKENGDVY